MMKKIYSIGALAAVLFASCKPNATVNTPSTSGEAVFTNYLAVGCSFSAGYADNSLTLSGQLNSYPQRLYEQFATIEDGKGATGPFIQPLLPGDAGYPTRKWVIGTVNYCDGTSSMAAVANPLPLDSVGSHRFTSIINNGQVNNIAVPGLRVGDYPVTGYAAQNIYANRFFYAPAKRPIDELYARVFNVHPTFFTVWMGTDDILGFALAGGIGEGTGIATPVFGNYFDTKDITPDQVFADNYDSIVKAVTSEGASGALINVPYVYNFPFFNTFPINGLNIERQTQADSLYSLYKSRGWDIVFQVGPNNYVVEDHLNRVRQAVPGEMILLSIPRDSITCAGWGTTKPIPNQYVLTTEEQQSIKRATDLYNEKIKFEAQTRKLAYVDVNSFFQTLNSGFAYNGIKYSASYISGGAFSLDGIHLNQRGNALLANHIINTINVYYKSTIPGTDANRYPGIKFP